MERSIKQKILIFIFIFVFCSSFCFPVYASDFFDSELWDYNDSYINDKSAEDKSLIFFPLAPESEFKNYMIFYANDDYYYLYLSDTDYGNIFYIYGGSKIVNTNPWVVYRYNKTSSSNWEFYCKSDGSNYDYYNYSYPGLKVVDATSEVRDYAAGDPIDTSSFLQKTGYRIYWQMSIILKSLCSYMNDICEYIMRYEILRYVVYIGFAGEVVFFVTKLIKKIGDRRDEEI